MRVSNIKHSDDKPSFIEVRSYENSVVNIASDIKPENSDYFTAGFWKIKYFNFIPLECEKLANVL